MSWDEGQGIAPAGGAPAGIPSAGADHFALVDEAPVNGDTDFVAMCARKDDAETREVRLKLKSGAVTEDGTTQAMAASYQYFSDVHEEDPDAVGPWTASSVNAMRIGIEVVT